MPRSNSRWRFIVVGALLAVLPSVLVLGTMSGTADAASTSPTGYFTFGPQAFGDASDCPIPPVGDFVSVFANQPVVGMAITPNCDGGWLATADGGVFSSTGGTPFYGSAGSLPLNAPIVGITTTPDGNGYWLVGADGGVFSYGDAGFYGSMGGKVLSAPVVGIARTHDGKGYWLVGADGGVFSFGDAPFYGSEGGAHLVAPITAISSTPDGLGYWLVAADGGVFTFGDAGYFGSLSELAGGAGGSDGGIVIANPVIGITPSPSGQGYFLLETTPAINPAKATDTGYELAKREWQITQYETSSIQGVTWTQAASYLTMGEEVDPGTNSGYPAAVQKLLQLASIPEMDVTPAQDAEGDADIAALTSFFNSPN